VWADLLRSLNPRPHPPEHWSEDFWPSWAAHPSKFCGFHDSDSPPAFQVLHRGEWIHPDDVDADLA
jgi:hypothetical protein